MIRRLLTTYGFVLILSALLMIAIAAGESAGNIHVLFLVPIFALVLLQQAFRKKRLIRLLIILPTLLLFALYIIAIAGEMTVRGQEMQFAFIVLPLACGIPVFLLWTIGTFRILRKAYRDTSTKPA